MYEQERGPSWRALESESLRLAYLAKATQAPPGQSVAVSVSRWAGVHRGLVAGVLAVAMAVSVLPGFCIAVLAQRILGDLSMSRTEFGLASAVIPAVAALSSIWLGGVADRRGGRPMTVLALLLGALSLLAIAGAPSFEVLLGATILAGVCQGGANPATNLVVLETLGRSRRGVMVGVKQSGEMAAIVAAGAALPVGALLFGWREAIGAAVLVPALAIVATFALIPGRTRGGPEVGNELGETPRLSRDVWWLTAYATIMGLSGGAISTYLPLYAQQGVGLTSVAAGQVLALTGLVAIPGRILWGQYAERARVYPRQLMMLSGLAAVGAVLLWAASAFGPGLLWVGAVLWGASQLSWGAVATLGTMTFAAPGTTGRASGVVLVGMSIGLMLGPIFFGFVTDATNGYGVGFVAVVGVLVAATLQTGVWQRLGAVRAGTSRIAH